MYSMLFGNNSGGGANALLDGAPFYLELTHTAVPQRGSITPAFTRATTETGQRWDEAGYLDFTSLANEMVFKGARRERNLIQPGYSSENMAVNNITSFPVAITPNDITPPAGYSRADRQTSTTAASRSGAYMFDPHVITAGNVAMIVCVAKAGSGRYLCLGDQADSLWHVMTLDTQDGSITTANLLTATAEEIEPGWWKMVMRFTKSTTGAVSALCCHSPTDTNGAYPFMDAGEYWWATGFQIHDLTGETDQTTIRPYVSVGVGVRTVATEAFDDAADWALNPGWSVAGGVMTGSGAASQQATYNGAAFYTGQKVEVSGTVTAYTSGSFIVADETGASNFTVGSAGAFSGVVTFPGGTDNIVLFTAGGFIGSVDNLVLKLCDHGSMVDGVKCYDTDRSGNPISTSGSYPLVGYVPWEARTNLCLRSQTFDNASWTKAAGGGASVPVVTADQGVAPDGTTTADKVVFVAPVSGDISTLSAAPATGAGTYTGSIYIKAFAAGDIGKIIGFRHVAGGAYTLVTITADWQRVATSEVRAANNFDVTLRPSEGTSTGTVSVYLWGAQVELGPFATPYIPTTTVAVARNASVLTYTGADVANIKTLAATFSRGVGVSTSGVAVSIDDGGLSERAHVGLSNATNVQFFCRAGGVDQWNTQSNTYAPGTDAKVAWAQETNLVKFDKDGTALTEDTVATMPNTNKLGIGHIATYDVFNGPVNHIYGWTRNLSQSELGAIDA